MNIPFAGISISAARQKPGFASNAVNPLARRHRPVTPSGATAGPFRERLSAAWPGVLRNDTEGWGRNEKLCICDAPPSGRRPWPPSAALGSASRRPPALPTASAAPCTASGLSSTASGVMADAGAYLAAHPDADKVLTDAGTQSTGEAKAAVQSVLHGPPGRVPGSEGIAQPLSDLRAQCGVSVSPGQLAALVESFQ